MNSTWQSIGGGVHMLKTNTGFYHVMQHGKTVWSATLNGRVVGTGKTLAEAQRIAENHA